MPTLNRKPRRRLDAGGQQADFTTEAECRAAVAAFRAKFATAELAEAAPDWRPLHRRLTAWVLLRTASNLTEDAARKIARIYLVKPHFLPKLPPERGEPQS